MLSNTDFSDGEFSFFLCYEVSYLEFSRVCGNFVVVVVKYCRLKFEAPGFGIFRLAVNDGILFDRVQGLSKLMVNLYALVVV